MTFAIIGLGYISSRHIEAIKFIKGKIVVGCDIDERTKDKLPKGTPFVTDYKAVVSYDPDIVVICTPNYLHYEMCKYFSNMEIEDESYDGEPTIQFKDIPIICEKPLVINPKQCNRLENNINVVHQLRYDKQCIKVLERKRPNNVLMRINIHRGDWYFNSWKNDVSKSGGLLYNIGVHYFDLLRWFLGDKYLIISTDIHERRAQGIIDFNGVHVQWEISLNYPLGKQERVVWLDDYRLDLNRNFESLHKEVYRQILKGKGIKPLEIKPTLQLIDNIINFK